MKKEFKSLREQTGMSVKEAADLFGVPLSTWYSYENGEATPSQDLLTNVARRKLNLSPVTMSPRYLSLFCERFNLSQQVAAALIGVSRVTFNRWLNKKSPIPPHLFHTLRDLAKELKSQEE